MTATFAAAFLPLWLFLDIRFDEQSRSAGHAVIAGQASAFAARVASAVNRRLTVVEALHAFVQSQSGSPSFERDLESFAAGLHAGTPGIRAIELVQNDVITFVFPLKGNEAVLNHDLGSDPRPEIRADLERARATGRHSLTGPTELWQGGLGLIARKSVSQQERFWGLVTVVLDVKPIVKEIEEGGGPVSFSLRDSRGRVFHGETTGFSEGSVIQRVPLPDGFWEVGATPSGGWSSASIPGAHFRRYLSLALVLAACALVYLLAERHFRLAHAFQVDAAEHQLVTDSVPVLISSFDSDWHCQFANLAHRAWFGCEPSELVGKELGEVLGREVASAIEDQREALARKERLTLDAAVPTSHKGQRFVTITCVPRSLTSEPSGGGFHLVATDITERMKAETENSRLVALVEASRDLIGIARLDGRLIFLNKAALTFFGVERCDEERGINALDGFPETHREQAWLSILPDSMRVGGWSGETQFQNRTTGTLIDVKLATFPIHGKDSMPEYFALVARDITESKRAERTQAALEAQLAEAQKMESIGRLAGGVAHDFNNLLTVIVGYANLALQAGGLTRQLRSNLEEISAAGRRAADLTGQLLAFSRRQVIQLKPVDAGAIVRGFATMLRRLLEADIELVINVDEPTWPVLADRGQLEQVLMNLAVNAKDAMPDGGKLTIEVANVDLDETGAGACAGLVPGRYALISCSDTGTGMDASTIEHIFEPFFTTKPVGAGTGLGLAMVFGIIAQCRGCLTVESELGRGSTFKIYLPCVNGECGSSTEGMVAVSRQGSETILVVDDTPSVLGYVAEALRTLGYKALEAGSADETLRLARDFEGPIDMLLTDVSLPDQNGRKLATLVKAHRPAIKVLFMSGYSADVISRDGILDEGLAFISKPFRPAALGAKVRGILGEVTQAPECQAPNADRP